jgi:hypothetical protein
MDNLKSIDKKIKEQEEIVRLQALENRDKLQYGQGESHELARLEVERELIISGVEWVDDGPGTVLINKKYIYALRSGRWRVKGKNKWYWSKNLTHFIKNYVGWGF